MFFLLQVTVENGIGFTFVVWTYIVCGFIFHFYTVLQKKGVCFLRQPMF